MISLTPAQARVKRAISDLTAQHGRAPSYQQIVDHLGLSSRGSAFNAVDELICRGHAVRTGQSVRNIRLLHKPVSRAPDGAPLYFVPCGEAAS